MSELNTMMKPWHGMIVGGLIGLVCGIAFSTDLHSYSFQDIALGVLVLPVTVGGVIAGALAAHKHVESGPLGNARGGLIAGAIGGALPNACVILFFAILSGRLFELLAILVLCAAIGAISGGGLGGTLGALGSAVGGTLGFSGVGKVVGASIGASFGTFAATLVMDNLFSGL